MSDLAIASREELVEHLVACCWSRRAQEGDRAGARLLAEAALERLLRRGLSPVPTAAGERFDPHQLTRALVARAGEPADAAWSAWQENTRHLLRSFEGAPRWLRFRLRREWHALPRDQTRPLVLRLPLPLREEVRAVRVALGASAPLLLAQREEPGRIELRLEPGAASRGPVIAELTLEFRAGETQVSLAESAPLGAPLEPGSDDALWLHPREGAIVCSSAIEARAAALAPGCGDVASFLGAAWAFIFEQLRLGDLDRSLLGAEDPLARLLAGGWTDCALGASLLCALCRARGIPARLVSGYLPGPGVASLHSWAEVRLAPGRWAPVDLACWAACGGDPREPIWGRHFLGRLNARVTCEVAPRQFTGWGSARPPPRWLKLHRLVEGGMEQSLRALPGGALIQRDTASIDELEPASL